jgi:hypothetical protein
MVNKGLRSECPPRHPSHTIAASDLSKVNFDACIQLSLLSIQPTCITTRDGLDTGTSRFAKPTRWQKQP